MTRPIIVPLDSSPLAERALPLAVAIARRGGTPLHLVTVNEPTQFPPEVGTGGTGTFDTSYDPVWVVPTGEARREYLDRMAGELREDGLAVETAMLEGMPSQALVEYAREHDPLLLVLATHGRGGLSRAWLGSTTDRLLRDGSAPMLVVRVSDDEAASDQTPLSSREAVPRRVLIPLDGSALAEQILGPALAVGRLVGWEYDLMRLVPVPYVVGSPVMVHSLKVDQERLEEARAEARAYMEDVRARLEADGHTVRTRVVEGSGGALAEGILEAGAELDAELIALATHGHGGLKRLVLGSVADKLIRAAEVPLLVFRPEESEEDE